VEKLLFSKNHWECWVYIYIKRSILQNGKLPLQNKRSQTVWPNGQLGTPMGKLQKKISIDWIGIKRKIKRNHFHFELKKCTKLERVLFWPFGILESHFQVNFFISINYMIFKLWNAKTFSPNNIYLTKSEVDFFMHNLWLIQIRKPLSRCFDPLSLSPLVIIWQLSCHKNMLRKKSYLLHIKLRRRSFFVRGKVPNPP